MYIHFHIQYQTTFGQSLAVQFELDQLTTTTLVLKTFDGSHWTGILDYHEHTSIRYRYIIVDSNTPLDTPLLDTEWGKMRIFNLFKKKNFYLEDAWRARKNHENTFLSSAFTNAIFKRNTIQSSKEVKSTKAILQLNVGKIPSHLAFGVIGDIASLGDWIQPVIMDDSGFPVWQLTIEVPEAMHQIAYKFVVIDPLTNDIITWESGDNRVLAIDHTEKHNVIVKTIEEFRGNQQWRGSGVAIPVFSLRSANGLGIGEFSDLIPMIDWSKSIGLDMIQILPVNDTIATKTWKDSYPYAAISVFALHPMYINVQKIGTPKNKIDQKELTKTITDLNKLPAIDFQKVLVAKMKFFKLLYHESVSDLKNNISYLDFITSNADWLQPYAVFSHLRDVNNSPNFNLWTSHNEYKETDVLAFCDPKHPNHKEVAFYFFLQFHADLQLQEVKSHARANAVVIKGDLPIGIYRYSADAWVAPSLYNMDEQAGAPPDDYAVLGQNWGFPTYNWSEMAKDGFQWWRGRMQHLNRYFDALRIDHILGFFRIWQIPLDQVEGTMGTFNPRLPLDRDELNAYGINGDLSRYTMPYITKSLLNELFAKDAKIVFDNFMEYDSNNKIVFKPAFKTQKKIADFITKNVKLKTFEKPLFRLISEVLLLVEPSSEGSKFNPRITLNTTHSYTQLDNYMKSNFTNLYNDYYYIRHDSYWKDQALWKLPALLDASDMMICGEDLGMIPKSVPTVMEDLNILTLEIQRMPKGNSKFGQVSNYPYFSVCSPSCHDMSTIRGWWEGDHDLAKLYYYDYLHGVGLTPMNCPSSVVQVVVEDHLSSPSMLAIFPIQDLIGIDDNLRLANAKSEQINEPSDPNHYWKFRFHLSVEDLLKNSELNDRLTQMLVKHGR